MALTVQEKVSTYNLLLMAEVVHRPGDTVIDTDCGRPPEHLLRDADVEAGPLQVPEPRRKELGFVRGARGLRDRRMQLPHRRFHTGADVEPLAAAGSAAGLDECIDDVVDEYVVAGVG